MKMTRLSPVVHQNFMTENKGLIYCKKNHKVEKLSKIQTQCFECPLFYGTLQGEGVECAWEDNFDKPFLHVDDPHAELKRVSNLIENKHLKRN